MKIVHVIAIVPILVLASCSTQQSDQTNVSVTTNDHYAFCGAAIVFESSKEGSLNSRDIYMSSPDGGYVVRLTGSPADDRLPKISPDGTKVVFRSDRDGRGQIYMVDIDLLLSKTPGAEKKLFDFDGSAGLPAFTPDNKKVVFGGRKNGQKGNLYLYDLQSQEIEQLTHTELEESFADVSSDGKKVVYVANPDGNDEEIFVLDLETKEVVQITDNEEDDYFPEWSPDDSMIAFNGQQSGEIYIYDMATGEITNATNHPAHDTDPSWTGDGKNIVFGSFRTGTDDVWILNLETNEVRNVTQSHHHGGHGDVSRTERCYEYL